MVTHVTQAQYEPAMTPRFAKRGAGLIRLVTQYSDEARPHVLAPWTVVQGAGEAHAYARNNRAELVTVDRRLEGSIEHVKVLHPGMVGGSYRKACETRDALEASAKQTGAALSAMSGGGPMGLTPDAVKASPEWREAHAAYERAAAALRAFNGAFVKLFKAERAAERREQLAAKTTR